MSATPQIYTLSRHAALPSDFTLKTLHQIFEIFVAARGEAETRGIDVTSHAESIGETTNSIREIFTSNTTFLREFVFLNHHQFKNIGHDIARSQVGACARRRKGSAPAVVDALAK